jgi:hypothetical protein
VQRENNKPKAIPYRPKRSMLSWVDYLVIAATILVFGAVWAANNQHAKAQSHAEATVQGLPQQTSQASDELGLIKARIRLAQGAPWG